MKSIAGAVLSSLFLMGCSGILDEQPRSSYDPTFFKTEEGVMGGLTSMYAHLRQFYGQYYYAACQQPTDEYTFAWSADNNFKDIDLTEGVGNYAANTVRSDALWNAVFSNINTASGVIENGTEAGVTDALIAEARFFRAFDYFQLVQTFGGVPLDLGSGELKFNITPVRVSARNTVPEVYTRAVFPDLKLSVELLPETGRVTGGVTKTLARLMLAKAYLTYGWWLENKGNIPTYPECPRTDPDGHDAAWYFQQAYDMAVEGIENPGNFGLLEYYYNVHLGSNDRNREVLLYADHTESSEFYDGQSHSYFSGGAPGNQIVWFVDWNYTLIRSFQKLTDGTTKVVESVQREAAQAYGRPWSCMAPPIGVFETTFADKVNDSRYDGTFVTVFRGNWTKGSLKDETTLYNANGMEVHPGDAILTFLDEDPADGNSIDYASASAKASEVAAGVMAGRSDYVIAPSHISRGRYPNLWKLGTYRTNNGDGLGEPNGGITRPINIAYFSELYFVAAEAAVKGAAVKGGKSARELINVIRARAGKWYWDNNGNKEKIQDNSAAMLASTPSEITIDYILAERSREYFGEGLRWFDLIRTQKLIEYAQTYEIGSGTNDGAAIGTMSVSGDHARRTYTRKIETYHYLRPIPTGQLNALEMTDAEKDAYQNPGY
ncbi:MAG: RagB/SusD family nutrient uptake outer membrane protein [Tannerellaceae bacterium]|nr:RagB/SusD family nutrient uptake outer membrane protein [Tannerellaceae bacterium]